MNEQRDEFLEMIDEYATPKNFRVGQIISAKVVSVDPQNKQVVFDYGGKGETWIPVDEFLDNEGKVNVKAGDLIDIMVSKKGPLRFSYKKALARKSYSVVKQAFEDEIAMDAKVTSKIKGGFLVEISGVSAFMPFSLASIRPLRKPEAIVDQVITGKIIEMNRDKVIFSRRAILEEEKALKKQQVLENMEIGKIYEGEIINIQDFGVFVDIGGMDGLVPRTEISFKRNFSFTKELKHGEKVNVKVLNYDAEKEKLLLSMKGALPDPWEQFASQYKTNDVIEGEVVFLKNFGAFVEIIPGVDGLIHISEMSWTEKLSHPSKMLKKGDKVKVKILNIKENDRLIALGLKQITANPWVEFKSKHPSGSVVNGKVSKIVDNGAEVDFEEGISGFIFARNLSWEDENPTVEDYFNLGEDYEFSILSVEPDRQRILLGRKQLSGDPVKEYMDKHRIGESVEVTVSSVNSFGLLVTIEPGVTGIVPRGEVASYDMDDKSSPSEGEKVSAKLIKFDKRDRKLVLSIKRYDNDMEKKELNKYLDRGESQATLGDLFKQKGIK